MITCPHCDKQIQITTECPHCKKQVIGNAEVAEIISEHYQKTFELVHSLWKQRSKDFMILLIIAGMDVLIAYRTEGVTNTLAGIYHKLVDVDLDKANDIIRTTFPFDLFQTILLATILYLMILIYHKTSHINRTYGYLSEVEGEIRQILAPHIGKTSFTREGSYYEVKRPWLLKLTGVVYVILLGALLLLVVFGNKLINGATASNKSVIDYIIFGFIAAYYLSYLYLVVRQAMESIKPRITNFLDKRIKTLWKDIKAERRLGHKIFSAFLMPGLLYSLLAQVPFYFFTNELTRPQFSIKGILMILLSIAILAILFGLTVGIWMAVRETRKSRGQTAQPDATGEAPAGNAS